MLPIIHLPCHQIRNVSSSMSAKHGIPTTSLAILDHVGHYHVNTKRACKVECREVSYHVSRSASDHGPNQNLANQYKAAATSTWEPIETRRCTVTTKPLTVIRPPDKLQANGSSLVLMLSSISYSDMLYIYIYSNKVKLENFLSIDFRNFQYFQKVIF